MSSNNQLQALESVISNGDLSTLSSNDRIFYYNKVCESLGLNPLTKPLQYIWLPGSREDNYQKRLTLYVSKDGTEQLRKINGISVTIVSRDFQDDLYIVTARATDKNGRVDESTGVVSFTIKSKDGAYPAKGELKANLLMKCETKAKRRVTLSISGLGWLDESETDSIPGAEIVAESAANLIGESKENLITELNNLIKKHKIEQETVEQWLVYYKVNRIEEINDKDLIKLINTTKKRIEVKNLELLESENKEDL